MLDISTKTDELEISSKKISASRLKAWKSRLRNLTVWMSEGIHNFRCRTREGPVWYKAEGTSSELDMSTEAEHTSCEHELSIGTYADRTSSRRNIGRH